MSRCGAVCFLSSEWAEAGGGSGVVFGLWGSGGVPGVCADKQSALGSVGWAHGASAVRGETGSEAGPEAPSGSCLVSALEIAPVGDQGVGDVLRDWIRPEL